MSTVREAILAKEQRIARAQAQEDQRRLDERLRQMKTREDEKTEAVKEVKAAAIEAASRLAQDDNAGWINRGRLKEVCVYTGPHPRFKCLFHRRTIAVVVIPEAHGYNPGYVGTSSMYLGEDEQIYRDGLSKIYRADLMARRYPDDIRALVPKLNSL